jgi:hypothetical protein
MGEGTRAAMELPQQVRSQVQFGNEGKADCREGPRRLPLTARNGVSRFICHKKHRGDKEVLGLEGWAKKKKSDLLPGLALPSPSR